MVRFFKSLEIIYKENALSLKRSEWLKRGQALSVNPRLNSTLCAHNKQKSSHYGKMANPPRKSYISRILGFFFSYNNLKSNNLLKISPPFFLTLVLLSLEIKQI